MKYVFVFFIGSILASCINVIAYRSVRKMDFIFDYSRCPFCNRRIKLYEMIPIISFLFLKGKCKNCKRKISIRYLLVEAIGGIVLIVCYYKGVLKYSVIFFILLLLSLIDIEIMEIEDYYLIILLILVLFINEKEFSIYFSLVFSFILLLLYKTKKIGGADIKLLIILSIYGVRVNIVGIYLTLFIAFIYCVYALTFKKNSIYGEIPFIPIISIGYMLAILYSQELIDIYYHFLLT